MCGVVSIIYKDSNPGLGMEASALLRRLEYRGYDSTGGAFFSENGNVILRKKTGAPSQVIAEFELEKHKGYKFIGQVRWATYGSVTDLNAQPHEMHCFLPLVGAHNGNISNTDSLKEYLTEQNHNVISDNDGEMLLHVVEHYYFGLLQKADTPDELEKIQFFLEAIRMAHQKVKGSYAACIAAPGIQGIFALKAGSSLYAGQGSDQNGEFTVVSSDLTSVLSKTRFLIPLSENEGVYFTSDDYFVFSMNTVSQKKPPLKRSRLNVADISLQSKYSFYMHQEIYAASENLSTLEKYYFEDEMEKNYFPIFEKYSSQCNVIVFELLKLYDIFEREGLKEALNQLFSSSNFMLLRQEPNISANLLTTKTITETEFSSDEAVFLRELLSLGKEELAENLLLLDKIVIWKKKRKILHFRKELISLITKTNRSNGRVFIIGAGTSYNASLVAGYFFNNISDFSVFPANPGLFRSLYMKGLREDDIIIGITQSGETKDLLDVFKDVREKAGNTVKLISVVNNENSTIPQEKSDFFLPILCGPEIAVAATKSFISQIALFYILALSTQYDDKVIRERLAQIRYLIDLSLDNCEDDISEVALKLFLKPSIHILGTSLLGLSREGALKIREVVLNHTEGYDAAEFKHGPNTILGRNTIFSLSDMEALIGNIFSFTKTLYNSRNIEPETQAKDFVNCLEMLETIKLKPFRAEFSSQGILEDSSEPLLNCHKSFSEKVNLEKYFTNYPLIFICAPNERDKRITISQIHTHKIRGTSVILIAQDDDELRRAVEGKPASVDNYYFKYIKIPKMFDANLFVFGAAITLQLLAFKMSVSKMKYLNRLKVQNHGVHPDVPKNVSKSITVD